MPFKCKTCKRFYKSKDKLALHLRRYCGVDPAYYCKLCEHRFKRTVDLRFHLPIFLPTESVTLFGAIFALFDAIERLLSISTWPWSMKENSVSHSLFWYIEEQALKTFNCQHASFCVVHRMRFHICLFRINSFLQSKFVCIILIFIKLLIAIFLSFYYTIWSWSLKLASA